MSSLPPIPEGLAGSEAEPETADGSEPSVLDRALASPRGIVLECNDENEAKAIRAQVYREREKRGIGSNLLLTVAGSELTIRKVTPGVVREL